MISVDNISLERYFEPVFQPVNFSLQTAEMLLVTGANGCGKTTLLRILAGILTPSQGDINNTHASMAYIGHKLAIKDDLNVLENMAFMQDFSGRSQLKPAEAAQILGLTPVAFQSARTLSAAQRKRCAIARLLLCDASLWLLDEPYSNLDQTGIKLVDTLVQHHCQIGGSCIMATHGSHRPSTEKLIEIELQTGRGMS